MMDPSVRHVDTSVPGQPGPPEKVGLLRIQEEPAVVPRTYIVVTPIADQERRTGRPPDRLDLVVHRTILDHLTRPCRSGANPGTETGVTQCPYQAGLSSK